MGEGRGERPWLPARGWLAFSRSVRQTFIEHQCSWGKAHSRNPAATPDFLMGTRTRMSEGHRQCTLGCQVQISAMKKSRVGLEDVVFWGATPQRMVRKDP